MLEWFFARLPNTQTRRIKVYPPPEITLVNAKSHIDTFQIDILSWHKLLLEAKGRGWSPKGTLAPPYERGTYKHPSYISYDDGGYFKNLQLVTDKDITGSFSLRSQLRVAWSSIHRIKAINPERLLLFALRPLQPELVKSIEQECRRLLGDDDIVLVDLSGKTLASGAPEERQAPPLRLPYLIRTSNYRVTANFMLTPYSYFWGYECRALEDFIDFCGRGEFFINISSAVKDREEAETESFEEYWSRKQAIRARLKLLLRDKKFTSLQTEDTKMDYAVEKMPELTEVFFWEYDLRLEISQLEAEIKLGR